MRKFKQIDGKIFIVEEKYTELTNDIDVEIAEVEKKIVLLKDELKELKKIKDILSPPIPV